MGAPTKDFLKQLVNLFKAATVEDRKIVLAFNVFNAARELVAEKKPLPMEVATLLTKENAMLAAHYDATNFSSQLANGEIDPEGAAKLAKSLLATAAFIGKYAPKTENADGWIDGIIEEALDLEIYAKMKVDERNHPNPIDELEQEVAGMSGSGDQDLIQAILLAARLHQLGRPAQFIRLAAYCGRENFEHLVGERCLEAAWEVKHAKGEDLAVALVAVQDLVCLRKADAAGELVKKAAVDIEHLEDEFFTMNIDEEAVLFVERWTKKYPLPEGTLLPCLEDPMTPFEVKLIRPLKK